MKIQLSLFALLAALVPYILAQMDPSMILTMMNPDIKLPPKPPRSLFPQYYVSPQQVRQRQLQERRRQEMALFNRLKAMTPAEIKNFQKRLTPTQLQQLVSRLRYLKAQMHAKPQQQQQHAHGQGSAPYTQGGPNMIESTANRIRKPSTSANSMRGRGGTAVRGSTRTPVTASSQRPHTTRRKTYRRGNSFQQFHKYRKKALGSMTSGCGFPFGMDVVETFLAFNRGGCRAGGHSMCLMKGMSCVDVESSVLCCPPGFTSGTLDAISYMKQMQAFMSQFQ